MSFDLNKLFTFRRSGDNNPKASVAMPELPKKNSPRPKQIPPADLDDDEDQEEMDEESEEDVDEKERSDASKDLGSTDTVMDVHSQILEVSHASVLARPHPPPLRPRHRTTATRLETEELPTMIPTETGAVCTMPRKEAPKSICRPVQPLGPRSVKATKAIRGKPKKLPWFKRMASAVRRKSEEAKEKFGRKKTDKSEKVDKSKRVDAKGKGGKKKTWKDKVKDKMKTIRGAFRTKNSTRTADRKKATVQEKKTQVKQNQAKKQINRIDRRPAAKKSGNADKKCQVQ